MIKRIQESIKQFVADVRMLASGQHKVREDVDVDVKVSMGMRVIRANGDVEDLGIQYAGVPARISRNVALDMGMEV